jgi:hypothetical protein
MDGPRIWSRQEREICLVSDRCGLPLDSIQWVPAFVPGRKAAGMKLTAHLHLVPTHTFFVIMCFVRILEQTAIISLYSINCLVFITETECVYCAVRTESLNNSTFCPHSVFMCFVRISEQTAIISLYSINWLVFITETGCLLRGMDWIFTYTFCPHSVFMCFVWISEQTASISLYTINWLVFITETECLLRGTDWIFTYTFCPHSVFTCFVWISEQTAIISLYSINWLVFITKMECVYCAVQAEDSYIIQAYLAFLRVSIKIQAYCS